LRRRARFGGCLDDARLARKSPILGSKLNAHAASISLPDEGIVVEEVGIGPWMESDAVPAVLRERLGPGATGALVDVYSGRTCQEMTALGASLRQDISAGQFERLKWCFLFWVGQLIAVAGVVGLMLRILRPWPRDATATATAALKRTHQSRT
jgi:hypothetical protein